MDAFLIVLVSALEKSINCLDKIQICFFFNSEKTFKGLQDSLTAYNCQSYATNKHLFSHVYPLF